MDLLPPHAAHLIFSMPATRRHRRFAYRNDSYEDFYTLQEAGRSGRDELATASLPRFRALSLPTGDRGHDIDEDTRHRFRERCLDISTMNE